MPKTGRPHLWTLLLPTLILMLGCSKAPDERLAELAEQSCRRQAEQNEVIAQQTEHATELSNDFIDAEAKARQELLVLQQQLVEADAQAREDLQTMHADVVQRDADGRRELDELQRQAHASIAARSQAIDHQREELEQERRQIAAERQRAPVVAEAIKSAAGLIVCAAPLVVVIYLLRSLRSPDDADPAMVELLVEELVAEQPKLLPVPTKVPALPSTASSDGAVGPRHAAGDTPADP